MHLQVGQSVDGRIDKDEVVDGGLFPPDHSLGFALVNGSHGHEVLDVLIVKYLFHRQLAPIRDIHGKPADVVS